jgi:hypothetical protein
MTAVQVPGARPAEATAQRVEELLERLASAGDPSVAASAEELVRSLMEFYGAGLGRVTALLSGRSGNPLGPLLDDELVAGMLVLHDLHPDDVRARIGRALRAAGAESDDVEVLEHDEVSGTLRLRRSAAGGCGCGGGTAGALRERVEAALSCFAPEIVSVELDETPAPREPVLLQIGVRPPGPAPAEVR